MSVLPLGIARVSNLLSATLESQSVDSSESQLLKVENEISTGKAISQPSDNPSASLTIIQIQQILGTQQTYNNNINSASGQLAETDSSLGSLTNLLEQAQTIASSDVNSDTSASQRQADAAVVKTIYDQALTIANSQYNGQYIFGGADNNTQPFTETNGVVQFTGSAQTLQNTFNEGLQTSFQANGANVFGSLNTGADGTTDLQPHVIANTRISDLSGATGDGVTLGTVKISINGAPSTSVDLSSAKSVGDVATLLQQAMPTGITVLVSGQGFAFTDTNTPPDTINISDVTGGQTATDLGINTNGADTSLATTFNGASTNPQITNLTPLGLLRNGAGLDLSGLTITNGSETKNISFAGATTVQDLLNDVNGAGVGVLAQINSAGTGINIVNASQGTSLSIGENGGTTAAELGVQTLSPQTTLSSLNNGAGVQIAGGTTPDFQITASDGTSFSVSLSSAKTVQDVLDAINTASGGKVTASLATTGSGIVLTDTAGGTGTLTVTAENNSSAASDLGLTAPASGGVITGTDPGAVQSTGIFGNLQKLIASLQTGNTSGMTEAAQGLQTDTNRVIEINGDVGAIEKELTDQQTSLTTQSTSLQTFLSTLQDTDLPSAISQFQTLQTGLQASLETAASTLQMSLLDYLS